MRGARETHEEDFSTLSNINSVVHSASSVRNGRKLRANIFPCSDVVIQRGRRAGIAVARAPKYKSPEVQSARSKFESAVLLHRRAVGAAGRQGEKAVNNLMKPGLIIFRRNVYSLAAKARTGGRSLIDRRGTRYKFGSLIPPLADSPCRLNLPPRAERVANVRGVPHPARVSSPTSHEFPRSLARAKSAVCLGVEERVDASRAEGETSFVVVADASLVISILGNVDTTAGLGANKRRRKFTRDLSEREFRDGDGEDGEM